MSAHNSRSDLEAMALLDALDAGRMEIFICTDGKTIGAALDVSIKSTHTMRSTQGYGDTVREAVLLLLDNLTLLDDPKEYLVVKSGKPDRRAVRWNGAAWKPVYEPAKATGDA